MSDLPLTFTVKCGEILLLEIRGIYRLCELLTRLIINMLEIDAPSDVLRLEKTNLLHINKLNIINAFDCRYPDSKNCTRFLRQNVKHLLYCEASSVAVKAQLWAAWLASGTTYFHVMWIDYCCFVDTK